MAKWVQVDFDKDSLVDRVSEYFRDVINNTIKTEDLTVEAEFRTNHKDDEWQKISFRVRIDRQL